MRARIGAMSAFFVACLAVLTMPVHAQGLASIPTPGTLPAWHAEVVFENSSPTSGGTVPNLVGAQLGLPGGAEIGYRAAIGGSAGEINGEVPVWRGGAGLAAVGAYKRSTDRFVSAYAIAGYRSGPINAYAGVVGSGSTANIMAGAAYEINPSMYYTASYTGGAGNFGSMGVAYAISPTTIVNPVLARSNATGDVFPFATVTVSFDLSKKPAPPSPAPTVHLLTQGGLAYGVHLTYKSAPTAAQGDLAARFGR